MFPKDEVVIRFDAGGDWEVPFEAAGALRARIGFAELLANHSPAAGRFTLVAEFRGDIVGILTAAVEGDSLAIEYLTRNEASEAAKGYPVGRPLLRASERLAARLGLAWPTLESLDDPALIGFYERRGFARAGPPLSDESWGRLHPMAKAASAPPQRLS